MTKSVSFEISQTSIHEPSEFHYCIMFHEKDEKTELQIKRAIDDSGAVSIPIQLTFYGLNQPGSSLDDVRLFTLKGRRNMEKFVMELNKLDSLQGGIVSTAINNEDKLEMDLLNVILIKARQKANSYAGLLECKTGKILKMEILPEKGNWSAFPPFHEISRDSLYSAILLGSEKKDKFVMKRTVKFEIELV